jgi:predicted nucleic acid-binding protein
MRWAILDTSVYIDHWELGRHEAALADVQRAFIVRQSSVVLFELRRGARTANARALVDALAASKIQWAPTAADWWRAGAVIQTLGDACHWDLRKRQAFQNDTLIALTARGHGATVVTANRDDFELLGRELGISTLIV